MMTEISLNILDVAENSTRAGATLVTILVSVETAADKLIVTIEDNGCGMTKEQALQVTDPFFYHQGNQKSGPWRSVFLNMRRKAQAEVFPLSQSWVTAR